MRALLLALWLLVASVWAAPPPNLSGTWVLDGEASADMDAILAARGASWVERQAIQHIDVVHEITQTPTHVTIAIRSPIYSRKDTLPTDNKTRSYNSQRMGPVSYRSYWSEAPPALVTVSEMVLPDGVPATFIVVRKLSDDGDVITMDLDLQATDGRHFQATRVLRRAAP